MSITIAFAMVTTTALLTSGKTAYAASNCDQLNIVSCGLSGNSVPTYLNSLRSYYQDNNDSHGHTDLQAVYNWIGASKGTLANMNSENTFLGTVYKNGNITVNGKLVATKAVITARFTKGTGYTHVEGNVYARYATTYEYYNTRSALVYMPSGTFAFAIELECGNAVQATATSTPSPKPTPTPTQPSTPTSTQTPTNTPTTLPNTGPGDIASIFAGSGMIGAAAHYATRKRRTR